MFFTGFADEAAKDIDGQIKATKALGWSNIESRNIDGVNIHDISEEKFEEVAGKLKDAGVQINCFGSAVANWAKDVTSDKDIQQSFEELERAIPRMQKLGTPMLRGMSFKMAKDKHPSDPIIEKLVMEKVGELVKRCEDAGIIYGHENCMNYGGQSHEHTLKLVENIDSPNFKLIYDTGNPPFSDRRIGDAPYARQSSWEFYSAIKEHIYYIHIKDAIFEAPAKDNPFPKATFTFPGEGDGDVIKIVKDLLDSGYDGGFSMEPHLANVFHEEMSEGDKSEQMLNSYIEYGQRFMKIVDECKA